MGMLIAVSGSQGSGKSTLLAELEQLGYPTVQRKTSRSILDEWDVTLSQVNNDRPLTAAFQEEILKRKFDDEKEAFEDKENVWFTERTFADLFVYALVAIGKDNEYNEWTNEYYDRCVTAQQIYDYVIYLQGGLFDVEFDGVRGINKHYSILVDTMMQQYTTKMSMNTNMLVVTQANLDDRVKLVQEIIDEFEE